jgi:hypothetical protein
VVRAVPALLRVFPRLDFAARIQVLVNSIPTRVFLSVVVARCQQKTERRDEDASQSEHRGNGLKGRGIIYLKRIIAQESVRFSVPRSQFTVRRQSHKSYRSYKSHPLSYPPVSNCEPHAGRQTPNAERRTPNAERRTPNAERQTPNAKRQTPNAKRQTPNAKRQTPNAKRQTPIPPLRVPQHVV